MPSPPAETQLAYRELIIHLADGEPVCGWSDRNVPELQPQQWQLVIEMHEDDVHNDFVTVLTRQDVLNLAEYLGKGDARAIGVYVTSRLERHARHYLLRALQREAEAREEPDSSEDEWHEQTLLERDGVGA